MCPALLALESSPKNDDSFSSPPRESSQSFGGGVETSTWKELLEAPEKGGALGGVGLMGKGEGQGGGPCFVAVL